ncbi:hypothetical protein CKK33_05005 [Mucilaginibacter sp. MD40]|uniref:YdcF family protein n=1 Tax=Mucilaginibacter sp. MD40 TaxID=2029590 RepID=UPI000BACC01D|nr:YdcF family protein [Mucilaginibacter sp. MD40]PAW92880.1 hypothetical protein CKK33_05005 [Mucilaginibacter sp. MD40]
MYFVLSKVLVGFAMPLFWVVAVLIYAAFIGNNRRRKQAVIVGLIVLYFFSVKITADMFARLWDTPPYIPHNQTYSAVVILGGMVSEDRQGNSYFNNAADRYYKGLMLYRAGVAKKIVFTGGNASLNPGKFTEAAFVHSELLKAGVADSSIILESKARNTMENAAFTKPLLQKNHLKPPYLLVTSASHMPRAKLLFKKAGIDIVAYPCQYQESAELSFFDFLPDTESMEQWNTYVKEVIGYVIALCR